MKRVYLDSNVFISLIDSEIGRNLRGLFVEAEQFLELVKNSGHILVLSSLFFEEVEKCVHLNELEAESYFENMGIKIEKIKYYTMDLVYTFEKLGLHFFDAVHAALAVQNNCDCIVTFNIRHFQKAIQTIKVFEPMDFA